MASEPIDNARGRAETARSTTSGRADFGEMVDLVKAYAKQETVQPLRNTGKFLVRGLAGGLLMAIGLILLCFAGLRAMQTETHAFDHGWSFVPYLVVVAGAAIVAVLFVMRISKGGLDG